MFLRKETVFFTVTGIRCQPEKINFVSIEYEKFNSSPYKGNFAFDYRKLCFYLRRDFF